MYSVNGKLLKSIQSFRLEVDKCKIKSKLSNRFKRKSCGAIGVRDLPVIIQYIDGLGAERGEK